MYLSGLQLDKNFALLKRLVDALILFGARPDLVVGTLSEKSGCAEIVFSWHDN